jgi:hypothetical protein
MTGKYFSLINFSNSKQTQESLESDFSKTSFRETNTVFMLLEIQGKFSPKIIHKIAKAQ